MGTEGGASPRRIGLKFLQVGEFREGSIEVLLDGRKEMPEEVRRMVEAHRRDFESRYGFTNNMMLGVTRIFFGRVGEMETPKITVIGQLVSYYEFLATNANIRLRDDLAEGEREWLAGRTRNSEPQVPVREFANPLGVVTLLLIEKGRKVVLARRSHSTAFRGGYLGASAMESVSPTLDARRGGDARSIDIFETIRRGLEEELGVGRDEVEEGSTYVTSLSFDEEVYDYKFTAVAAAPLSEGEIRERYELGIPKDKYESSGLVFLKFPLTWGEIEAFERASGERLSPEARAALLLAGADLRGWSYVLR